MEGGAAQSPVEFVNLQLNSPVEPEIQPPPYQLTAEMNLRVVLEPKGFMKVLQFVFSIFAFATTSGFSTYVLYDLICTLPEPTVSPEEQKLYFSYPFKLSQQTVKTCGKPKTLIGDFSSQSEYFVATGVLAFLYCIAALIIYVFLDKLYHSTHLAPITDFAGTLVMAVFWLTASAAWAQGLADFKYFSNPVNIYACKANACKVELHHENNYATLNVSVIFGFLNFILWASNLWFIYKETPWFLARSGQPDSQHV